ncbi:MAG: hypothetical protein ACPGQP_02600 [Nitrosopumilus sp.]
MNNQIDSKRTLEVIERMKHAKIGEYKKWQAIVKKINSEQPLDIEEVEYYTNLTRIYKDSNISKKSKIYHTKLSEQDEKPPCSSCSKNSLYYCNMNDQYFCSIHVVGHDENEF